MADNLLGHAPDLDQRVEIDAGVDPHFLAEQHQFLGAHITGGLGLTGKRAAAEATDRRVELRHTHLEPGVGVGDRKTARIVQVQRDRHVRPATAHLSEHTLDPHRRRPAHRVGEREVFDVGSGLRGDRQAVFQGRDHLSRRDIALVVAAESRHDADARHIDAVFEIQRRLLLHRLDILRMAAVQVFLREAF